MLRDDGFSRRREAAGGEHRGGGRSGVLLAVCIFLAVSLLVLSRAEHAAVNAMRSWTIEALAPTLEVLGRPAAYVERIRQSFSAYVDLVSELDRVRQEKRELEQWQWRAQQLEAEIAALRKLMNGVKDRGFAFVTARVVAEGRGPFTRSVLVNAGRAQGVRNGFAVVNSDGLVGRVVETSENASRILLLSDVNSRIPVLVGRSFERAIIRGKSASRPALEFFPGGNDPQAGDDVVTSGQDGLLPRGLRVGRVVSVAPASTVETSARLEALDYVSILFFEAPGLELANGGRSSHPGEALASRNP
jgi:rod shape-determining protein MreC